MVTRSGSPRVQPGRGAKYRPPTTSTVGAGSGPASMDVRPGQKENSSQFVGTVRRARVAIGSCNPAGCSAYCPHSGGEHPASPRLADSDDRSGRDRPWRAWKLHYPRHPRAFIAGRPSGGLTRSTGSTDGEVAAVGHDGCTGDIARVLRQQEPDHRSDVVRRIAEVTERMASEYPLRQRRVRSHRQLHGG